MKITIHGVVQGVGFRPTVHRIATRMGLNGYVQNNGSNVVIEIDGDPSEFLSHLMSELPPLAKLDDISVDEGTMDEEIKKGGFRIIESGQGEKGVAIPNDHSICDNCIKEMFDPKDRRYLYPFTNCTDCGARFTIIDDLPYDREKTSMRSFQMCDECRKEYEDPTDRRFHHQTISCKVCGPSYYVLDKNGAPIEGDPATLFAQALSEGKVGIIKSWGGMHICSSLDNLRHLREWYRRKEKPFAIMVRDLDAVFRYSRPTKKEIELLTSGHRPIVLVEKVRNALTELVSPGLGNIGIFLPYTEMQHILFSKLRFDALVMTSANVPGEPMVLTDKGALALGADVYLMHNREIFNRCDDSVVRTYGDRTFFIRRSRGHVPFNISFPLKGTAIGLGAQENIVGSLAFKGRLHCTQYIGDSSSAGVLEYLEGAIGHLRNMLGAEKIDAIGIDLHPGYSTRRLGMRLSSETGARVVEVQHHWAHGLALMLDNGLDDLVTIAIDGTGYGTDGKAWGGEVLDCSPTGFERVGHLQEVPLLGGEKAVYDIRRLVFAIESLLGRDGSHFSGKDAELFMKMLPRSTTSTSLGRLMDAVSCALGVCMYRSYDGEPAMKLEPLLATGKVDRSLRPMREGDVIRSVEMFSYILDRKGTREDVAATFIHAVLEGLVDIAAERAKEKGAKVIGVTGGVSYNSTVARWLEEMATDRGLSTVFPKDLPNGDGCISAGQCLAALAYVR
ncbi:MAG: carbamoyltransferase HypF [Methanomassiliicoccales archaeon]|nr:MAG: carbamoyltransferase HypF [Methanomassiliicoccales archaeon]